MSQIDRFQVFTEKKPSLDILNLDPRVKLFFVILFTTATFMSANQIVLIWNYILIVSLWILSGKFISAIKIVILFSTMLLLQMLCGLIVNETVAGTLVMILVLTQRTISFLIMASWFTSDLCINDLITALNKMKIPTGITITLAIMFRYIPTVKKEFKCITNTMRLRNINVSVKNIFMHPIRTVEYTIVPLVLRTLTIADQLSASVMTRGLDLDINRSSYRIVKITMKDIVILIIGCVLVIIGDIEYGRF